MILTRPVDLKGRLDQAILRLMASRVEGEHARLTVPVSYPSGSSCAVDISLNGDKCFVSDIALGHMEAEMQGAVTFYNPCAKQAAERFGVDYDGLSIFALWSSIDRIETAISAVANASAQAATNAIYKAVEEKDKHRNTELFERVSSVFGANVVAKTLELPGKDAAWEAHNVVALTTGKQAVFEYVSGHQNSISSKYMMFSDLAKIEGAYSLNSVVRKIDELGKKGAMLADVSHIISINADNRVYREYADAA